MTKENGAEQAAQLVLAIAPTSDGNHVILQGQIANLSATMAIPLGAVPGVCEQLRQAATKARSMIVVPNG